MISYFSLASLASLFSSFLFPLDNGNPLAECEIEDDHLYQGTNALRLVGREVFLDHPVPVQRDNDRTEKKNGERPGKEPGKPVTPDEVIETRQQEQRRNPGSVQRGRLDRDVYRVSRK